LPSASRPYKCLPSPLRAFTVEGTEGDLAVAAAAAAETPPLWWWFVWSKDEDAGYAVDRDDTCRELGVVGMLFG